MLFCLKETDAAEMKSHDPDVRTLDRLNVPVSVIAMDWVGIQMAPRCHINLHTSVIDFKRNIDSSLKNLFISAPIFNTLEYYGP